MQETLKIRVRFLVWEDPLEEEMATHSKFLPGESHGQRSLVGSSPWGRKESDTSGHARGERGSAELSVGYGSWPRASGLLWSILFLGPRGSSLL